MDNTGPKSILPRLDKLPAYVQDWRWLTGAVSSLLGLAVLSQWRHTDPPSPTESYDGKRSQTWRRHVTLLTPDS